MTTGRFARDCSRLDRKNDNRIFMNSGKSGAKFATSWEEKQTGNGVRYTREAMWTILRKKGSSRKRAVQEQKDDGLHQHDTLSGGAEKKNDCRKKKCKRRTEKGRIKQQQVECTTRYIIVKILFFITKVELCSSSIVGAGEQAKSYTNEATAQKREHTEIILVRS